MRSSHLTRLVSIARAVIADGGFDLTQGEVNDLEEAIAAAQKILDSVKQDTTATERAREKKRLKKMLLDLEDPIIVITAFDPDYDED